MPSLPTIYGWSRISGLNPLEEPSIVGWESRLNQSEFWGRAAMILNDLHSFDPEMILQGCLFEVVATEVDSVPIPPWGL